MAVEAVVALMVDKLDELVRKDAQLLGVNREIKHIRAELNQMRLFLKDADIKQKEDEAVRVWMKDIRDICFDVDDVIDILGQGQAAQGRHGFVERLKRCISDQITRYMVGKEIERIKLNIKGLSRSRESYGIREINEERPEAASSTQRSQEVTPEKKEIVSTTVDDQLTNEERTRDIDEGRQEASSSSRNLQAHRPVSTLPGEPEEVGLQEEINTVGQQLIEEEPRLWDGTRDISEGKLEASSSTPGLKADRQFSTLPGEPEEVGLQEGINTVSQQFIEEEPGPHDGTRDIDEGKLEESSPTPGLKADRRFSTLPGEPEEVGLQEELYKVSQQLIKEEPSPCDGTRNIDEGRQEENWWQLPHPPPWFLEQARKRQEAEEEKRRSQEAAKAEEAKKRFLEDLINSAPRLQEVSRCYVPPPPEKIQIVNTTVNDQLTNEERTRDIDEGRQEASSSSRNLQAHRPVSTLPGEPEEVGLQEEINTVGQQLIEEEPRLWDGTRDISEGKLEASSSTPSLKADRRFSTLPGEPEEVGLQEEINTVGQQLIEEDPRLWDGTRDISEGKLEASSSTPGRGGAGISSPGGPDLQEDLLESGGARPTRGIARAWAPPPLTLGLKADRRFSTLSCSNRYLEGRRGNSVMFEEPQLVGRHKEFRTVRDQLMTGEQRRRVISIFGIGGSGKTALAEKILNDVKGHFNCHALVYVSQQCQIKDVLVRIIKGVAGHSAPKGIEKMDEVGLGLMLRHNYLRRRRYLVVLDDLWTTEAWDSLILKLPDDGNKSRVLVTTRIRDVALHADPSGHHHEMRLLNDDESWELFMKKIFPGKDPLRACPSELKETGWKILKKCGGLPLAILVLGGLLATKDKREAAWSKVLKSSKKCMDILALSYWDLPPYLKPCFLYFGLLPENYEIDSRKMIRLWIDEGFIQKKDNKFKVAEEKVAVDYLEELVSRSMIQVASKWPNGSIRKCRIHDLLRELSIFVATKNNFFPVDNDNDTSSSSTRVTRLAASRNIGTLCSKIALEEDFNVWNW